MLKHKKTAGSTWTMFWAGARLGCPWKCTEASAAVTEAPGDRSERERTGAEWCRLFAATVRILNSR